MSVNLESKKRIDSLISAANAVTGKTDTDLTTAVNTLAAGFQQSGGGGLPYDMGEFLLSQDAVHSGDIPHNLGQIPDFVLIWTDYFRDKGLSPENPNTEFSTTTNLGIVYLRGLSGLVQRLTSTPSRAAACR